MNALTPPLPPPAALDEPPPLVPRGEASGLGYLSQCVGAGMASRQAGVNEKVASISASGRLTLSIPTHPHFTFTLLHFPCLHQSLPTMRGLCILMFTRFAIVRVGVTKAPLLQSVYHPSIAPYNPDLAQKIRNP